MKKIGYLMGCLVAATLVISSCGGSGQQPVDQKSTTTAGGNDDMKAQMVKGEQIYKTKCIVCHQATGLGVPGVFPPLANSDYLLADKVRAVSQALNGSKMEITVNGNKYTQEMVPQVDTKEDAVAVINYVLNNFGNNGGQVTLDEVQGVVIKPRVKK
jgi:mono/diheme cytochrome c family protein